jgi:hypothetical protein
LFFFVRRNYHLDWDGFSHCSAIEQNFNPLVEDINRRQKLGLEVFFFGGGGGGEDDNNLLSGYPRLLSGDMRLKKNIHHKQDTIFPELAIDNPWESVTAVKRHYMQFPFYPFRTLNTRDLASLGPVNEFDTSSPIFPAHTQLNIVFKRRATESLLSYMLPYNLNYGKGSSARVLTPGERNVALTYSVPDAAGAFTDYVISDVQFIIKDLYLQVYLVSPFPPPAFSTLVFFYSGMPNQVQKHKPRTTAQQHL